MAGLRLVSVNIERSKHLDRVERFIRSEDPDIVCMQEICERDIDRIAAFAGTCVAYAPSGLHPADPPETGAVLMGNAIFTRATVLERGVHFYRGSDLEARTGEPRRITSNLGLVTCDIEHEGTVYRIATLHFTWTPDGSTSDEQRESLALLLPILSRLNPLVFCGDFNAPRGGEIFTHIAGLYTDNIPPAYTTSIDGALHRAGPLPLMVDGLFSSPEFVVSNVRLQDGVSDHMAIVAEIAKRSAIY